MKILTNNNKWLFSIWKKKALYYVFLIKKFENNIIRIDTTRKIEIDITKDNFESLCCIPRFMIVLDEVLGLIEKASYVKD